MCVFVAAAEQQLDPRGSESSDSVARCFDLLSLLRHPGFQLSQDSEEGAETKSYG